MRSISDFTNQIDQSLNRNRHRQRGMVLLRALIPITILIAVGLSLMLYMFGVLIPPGEIGVRNIAFRPFLGYSERALEPGVHWNIPFYSQVFHLPKKIRTLDFHRGNAEGKAEADPLQVPTGVDRAIVEVDTSVLYQIYTSAGEEAGKKHGGPVQLLQLYGVDPKGWDDRVKLVAERVLKVSLRRLSASDFYKPKLREQAVERAVTQMNEELGPNGIKVVSILLRRYTYQNESLEENIFNKNLEAQNQRVKEEERKLAEAQALYTDVESKGTASVETLKRKGESDAERIVSEANAFETEKKAQGDLLLAQTKAQVDKLRATALERSSGSDIYVARQLAPLLGSLRGGVVTQIDPYDLESWMKRLGIGVK